MELKEKIQNLISEITKLQENPDSDTALPQNTFYLNENDILCLERKKGDSRYPYDADGLVVWAHSSGHIDACESTFTVFKTVYYSEDPSIGFFAGLPMENGEFFPVSVLGANRQLFESPDIKRYLVYSFKSAYYITDTKNVTFAVRLHVTPDKHIHFSFCAINKTDKPQKFYLCSTLEAIIRFKESEHRRDIRTKYGHLLNSGYLLRGDDNCLVINQNSSGGEIIKEYRSVAKSDFIGGKDRGLTNALALKTGMLETTHTAANTTDVAMASDIVHYELCGGGMIRREYDISYYYNETDAKSEIGKVYDYVKGDAELEKAEADEIKMLGTLKVDFRDWKGKLNPKVLNKFVRSVQKQVSFCAFGKNYVGPLIGIRDVMQQLESSLIWNPKESRRKILTALNFILEDGRPPRQFSLPATPDAIPEMNLKEYIDQGVWIISTLYTYLAFTDDYSILDEKCSYYVISEDGSCVTRKSEIYDTVLDHILKIFDFLTRNIDEQTGCLHALYGDWNDAIETLGYTDDKDKKFGTGVTVMASLQLMQNCRELTEILKKINKHTDRLDKIKATSDRLVSGLMKYAVDTNAKGERRILHGWGDKMSYKVGSWNDPDGKARRSTTSNAFWAITGMIQNDTTLKDTILSDINAVKSKYGIKTFDECFDRDMKKYFGRICTLTPGTCENAAAYVHASMFAIMAMFALGNSKEAWEQFEISSVISHGNCSLTTFVMPNSYCNSKEYESDGESMGDWHTGSGTVLIKILVKYGFGICPTLDGLKIQTSAFMPCDNASMDVLIKGHPVTVRYSNAGNGERTFTVDGKPVTAEFDALMNTKTVVIPASDLHDNTVIEIKD